MATSELADRVGPRRAVLALVLGALLLRFVALGQRAVHWDEARVGYWVLRYAASGTWAYHPIIHGPFVQHASRLVFEAVGANTTTLRAVVALVGGLLPAAALLFRTRLADGEVVALALVLAVDPLVLHYSRFLRSDVLLAAFALVAFGAGLRALDTRRVRWVYVAALALALAFTTKENAVLYLASWAGSLTLVAGWWLLGRPADERADAARERLRALGAGLWRWRAHLLLSAVGFALVFLGFYAPRSGSPGGVGLWNALGDPSLLPAVVSEATLGTWEKLQQVWLSGEFRQHSYLLYAGYYALVLGIGAGPVVLLGLLGVVRGRGRPLVATCGWWGLSSAVGYPYVADTFAPWLGVHVVVALAVPAAVGLASVVDSLRRARHEADQAGALLAAAVLVVAGAQVALVAAETTYTTDPGELNLLANGAQPGSNLNPTMRRAAAAAGDEPGPDVLYVGGLAVPDEAENDDFPAASNWYERLPLPWYTEAAGLRVTSVRDPAAVGPDAPPVVVAAPKHRDTLESRLPAHTVHRESLFLRPRNRTLSVLGYQRQLEGRSILVFVRDGDR